MKELLIRYQLIRAKTPEKSVSLISASYGGDTCVCQVPVCEKTPDEIYAIVRDNGVTPCTLADVLRDLAYTPENLAELSGR